MSDIGALADFSLPVISTASINSVGIEVSNTVSASALSTSAVWPSANLAIYVPFRIATPTTIVKMFWYNGVSVGTDSVDVGIYDSQGNQLVHSGSTLTAGASAMQIVDTTDVTLQRGLYYVAMAMSGTTNNVHIATNAGVLYRAAGVYNQATAFPLPSLATFVGATAAGMPFIGMALNTLI